MEIADLLDRAKALPDDIGPGRRMSQQECQLRMVVVALVAALQSFLTEMLEERADGLGDSWETLSDLERRYVAVQARRRLAELVDDLQERDLNDANGVSRFRNDLVEVADWHRVPSALARSRRRERLGGLLQDNGSKALERILSGHSNSPHVFFDWLSKYFPRYRGAEETFNSMVAIRNDVAHGSFLRRTTLREVRVYRTLVYRIIGKIERYIKP